MWHLCGFSPEIRGIVNYNSIDLVDSDYDADDGDDDGSDDQ